MLTTVLTLAGKAAMSLGLKLLSEKLLEELIMFGVRKLAASTKTKVDDQLVAMIDGHLNGEDEEGDVQ